MVSEAGVPELACHEIPRELLQPLVSRYEIALSQLEKTVKVRALGPRWGFCKSSLCSGSIITCSRKGRQAGSSPMPWERPPDHGTHSLPIIRQGTYR